MTEYRISELEDRSVDYQSLQQRENTLKIKKDIEPQGSVGQ